ncbi:MAG: LLM class flavin-dependent oxidoreductase [Gammaproteobacteria bacterium]|nr:LLM class flavin-dependent oxidoreductase [Gammaproteobacteria bacterium]
MIPQPLEFGWFLPTNGDTTSFVRPAEVPQSLDMFDRVTRAAEDAKFEYMLVPVQTACWEAWIASAIAVGRSRSIKMLVAARPGYINPVLLAKMISTFDQLSAGRICINLIAGASDEEARSEGIKFAKEERYEVMEEEVTIIKRLWESKRPIDFDGRYYQLDQAQIRPRIYQRPYPQFYLGGGSQRAWHMSGKHADVHLFWGDHPERIAEQIAKIRTIAGEYGREDKIGFGMRLQIICRENEEDAWAHANKLIEGASDKHKTMIRTMFGASEANRRMQELSETVGQLLLPNLWTGITTVRPGAGVAVVGNPEQCAATLQQFIDVGCHSFCLSGYLHDAEAERFGRLVRPRLVEQNPARLSA